MRTLYHYTSLDALLGIIHDKAIRLTDVNYLNDYAELSLFDSISDALFATPLSAPKPLPAHVFRPEGWSEFYRRGVKQSLRQQVAAIEFLGVACFSTKGDDLSQWRGYTKLGTGVCIEFNFEILADAARAKGFKLAPCIYNDSTEYAEEVERWRDQFDRDQNSDEAWPIVDLWLESILESAIRFKHHSFKDEREWRLISTYADRYRSGPRFRQRDQGVLNIEYRVGTHSIIPYTRFDLPWQPNSFGNSLAISRIIVGPTREPYLSKRAIVHALREHKIECQDEFVVTSQVPYRQV